jgi:hypothetical protein
VNVPNWSEETSPWWEVASYSELTPKQVRDLEEIYGSEPPDPPRTTIPTCCPQCSAYIDVGDLFGVIGGHVVICSVCYQLQLDVSEQVSYERALRRCLQEGYYPPEPPYNSKEDKDLTYSWVDRCGLLWMPEWHNAWYKYTTNRK